MSYNRETLIATVRENCTLSDARDNGIYSMCMLFMRLRNLFKWENGIDPWEEVEPPLLLDWISQKEDEWDLLTTNEYRPIPCGKESIDPLDVQKLNASISPQNLCYGAGLGKSLKAVFFLAHIDEYREEGGCPVVVLGKEEARELDSPFALLQDETIVFRTEPFCYFLWDRVMDTDVAKKVALEQALSAYDLLDTCGKIKLEKFKSIFDFIVKEEMVPIIRHEVGELMDKTFTGNAVHVLISHFPGTVIELLTRSTKDALADLHEEGMLGWIIANQRKSSLGFYLTFIDGFRKMLVPEIKEAANIFWETGDWDELESARLRALNTNTRVAGQLSEIASNIGKDADELILARVKKEILESLGV